MSNFIISKHDQSIVDSVIIIIITHIAGVDAHLPILLFAPYANGGVVVYLADENEKHGQSSSISPIIPTFGQSIVDLVIIIIITHIAGVDAHLPILLFAPYANGVDVVYLADENEKHGQSLIPTHLVAYCG